MISRSNQLSKLIARLVYSASTRLNDSGNSFLWI